MPTSIVIDRHIATLEIPDAEGEVFSYTMEPLAAGLDAWAVTLRHTESGDAYRVAVDDEGRWRCNCPDWIHRRRKSRGHTGPCKHMIAARDLFALVELLGRKEEP